MEVSMTTFGFAGLALIRPHHFGISVASQRQRVAFLHFWAVINHMLGVQDRFNICLQPIKAAEVEFDVVMRNVLTPYLQLETLAFKQMVTVLLRGLSGHIPLLDYDTQMFLIKRAIGIPGYQLDVNYDREIPHRNIFSAADLAFVRQFDSKFSDKIQIYKVKKHVDAPQSPDCRRANVQAIDPYNTADIVNFYDRDTYFLKRLMGLPCQSEITVQELTRDESYRRHLSAKQFHRLNGQAQFNVNMYLAVVSLMAYPEGVAQVNQFTDSGLQAMRNVSTVRYEPHYQVHAQQNYVKKWIY